MMKDTAKDEWKDAMGLQLKDGTAKEDTNVQVDVHKPAQKILHMRIYPKKKNCCVMN